MYLLQGGVNLVQWRSVQLKRVDSFKNQHVIRQFSQFHSLYSQLHFIYKTYQLHNLSLFQTHEWCKCSVKVYNHAVLFTHMYIYIVSAHKLKIPRMYMLQLIFLSQVIFIFLLFQLHQHILPYPKTKEKQKLPEIKN